MLNLKVGKQKRSEGNNQKCIKHINKLSKSTLQFQIIVPTLINFWIFCQTPPTLPPFLIWTPPLINFPDFILQILQRLFKRIVLFAKL